MKKESQYLLPKEISEELVKIGQKKAKSSLSKLIVSGFLAGVYIAIGSHLSTVVTTEIVDTVGLGLSKFFGGLVFSFGLIMVVIAGAELFTGNVLLIQAFLQKKISLKAMLRNWLVVYFANFVGAIFFAILVGLSAANNDTNGLTLIGQNAVKIASLKVTLPMSVAFFRAIAANWLVCIAVIMATSAKDISGKILAIIFPILAFVAMGFEHSIANMYFLPAGLIAAAGSATVLSVVNIAQNLLVVTAGNIAGGLFVGTAYWYIYLRR